ncbi:carbohydrate-binding protein [Salininema proteolyticum]|uniref:Carbohydrate-binding protein n=1 Tax=Salininema proteolyticum TaxID=1607685 RepID=A0ABV8TY54_9ACTN
MAAAAAGVLTAVSLATAPTASAETDADAAPGEAGAAAEWDLVWADEFDGPAGQLPDSSLWQFDIGHSYPGGPDNWGTGEIAYHTDDPDNISLDGNGNLEITALRDANGDWTSARIETHRGDFKPPAGGSLRIEGNLQIPGVTGDAALGYWPAFWALGSPYRGNYWNWPAIGEFDIMENVNGNDWVAAVLHCGVPQGGPCNETLGLGHETACPTGPCPGEFHEYAFEWDDSGPSQQLRWYVDGQLHHTVSEADMPADTWADMTGHAGYFILLNLAIGGAFPDGVAGFPTPTAATESGHSLLVDYVRVYTADGDPCGDCDPDPGDGHDAYEPIAATSYDGSSGVPTADDSVGPLSNGDWLRFDGVEFGSQPPLDVVATVASGAPDGVSGLVEVRIGSPTAPPIGSFALGSTGGWNSFTDIPGNVDGPTGTHNVYLTFTAGHGEPYVTVRSFRFRR